MKVLLDTNVVLDILLSRAPWVVDAGPLWQASQNGHINGCITASALTDVYYISRRLAGKDRARQIVRECLDALIVLTIDAATLEDAYALAVDDFEDALQMACAGRNQLDAIVTRDASGFARSVVPVMTPAQVSTLLQAGGQLPSPPGNP
ncbi:MAG: PIN domain-containing protein [Gemmataceae bacterium]|nr:PIN domain-containing protein [Gemmataceae bacterium]